MTESTSSVSKVVATVWAACAALGGTALGGVTTYFTEHAKLVEAKIADQKTTEINAFLKVSQEMYPLVADEVGRLKTSTALISPENKALIKNLQVQYSTLESAASYLPDGKRGVAVSYQGDLVRLLHEVKATNDPLQAGQFVDTLHDAVIHRCEVTAGLRISAGLPESLDPACGKDQASAAVSGLGAFSSPDQQGTLMSKQAG